jgi:membrane protein DedA with SNARE-associated domain
MTYAHLIHEYGYAGLVVATFLQGEAVLLLGAAAAHLGLLALPGVVAAGLAGTLLSDQAWFLAGRRGGAPVVERFTAGLTGRGARVGTRAARLRAHLERHPDLLILCYRGLYGLRIATLVLLGMSRVSTVRFAVLNAIGGLLWAVLLGATGYLAGGAAGRLGPGAPALVAATFLVLAATGALRLLRRPAPQGPGPEQP